MSNFTIKFILVSLFLAVGGTATANAQANGAILRADIPYDFVLRDKTFPAGKYTIQRTYSTGDSPSLLVLQGEKDSAIFDTLASNSNDPAKSTHLVFDVADGVYFLSKIRVKGSTSGSDILKTRSEAKRIAQAKSKKSVTVGP